MSSEFYTYTLSELCSLISRGVTPSYVETGGICVLNQKCIRDAIISFEASRKTDHNKKKIAKEKYLQPYDILVNSTGQGTLGRVAQIKEISEPITVDSHVTIVRPKSKIVYPYYLGFVIRDLQPQIEQLAEGSTGQTELSRIKLGELEIKVPEYSQQILTAKFLGALDDRIALLRETNATLESIAQAIFKSWFIEFDAVKAKQQGLKPQGMDAATAALFPDAFQDSELGPIPAGWEVLPLGELVRSVGGGTPSTKDISYWEPAEFAWTTPKDLSAQDSPVLLKTERMISEKGVEKISSGLLPKGTLLLSSRAPVGYLAIAGIPLCINQGYIAILPDSVLSPLFMLFWCKNHMELIKNRSNGSTFMEISKKSFRGISAIKPPDSLVNFFTDSITPVFDRIVENEQQSQTLASIRDTLLPRLISGRLRLPEAEAMAVEVGL